MRGWCHSRARTLALLVAGSMLSPGIARAAAPETERDDRPARGIAVYTEFPGVVVPVDEKVRLDLVVANKGRADETVTLEIVEAAQGWDAALRGRTFTVTGVSVPDGKTRTLTFSAEPAKDLAPGTYAFVIEGRSADAELRTRHTITITTQERRGPGADDIKITTAYPVLRGPGAAKFEFSLDVENDSDGDRLFSLNAKAPPKWDVNFRPGYEQKLISSLQIRGGQSQTVAVEVTPPKDAEAGEYAIVAQISSGASRVEQPLTVVVTGIYRLEAATASGLLTTQAVAGRATTLSLLLRNTGTAANRNVGFSARMPDGWEARFAPERLEAVEPGALKQVDVSITPAAQAAAGDYAIDLTAAGEKATKAVELRVTVSTPSAWGWVAIGILVVVIGGVGGLLAWLGRR